MCEAVFLPSFVFLTWCLVQHRDIFLCLDVNTFLTRTEAVCRMEDSSKCAYIIFTRHYWHGKVQSALVTLFLYQA